jgi:hypothetical protein
VKKTALAWILLSGFLPLWSCSSKSTEADASKNAPKLAANFFDTSRNLNEGLAVSTLKRYFDGLSTFENYKFWSNGPFSQQDGYQVTYINIGYANSPSEPATLEKKLAKFKQAEDGKWYLVEISGFRYFKERIEVR